MYNKQLISGDKMQNVEVKKIIQEFIKEMGYLDNKHVLGVFFYGSYQLGCANEKSDIDLHIVFDDADQEHMIRGNHFIDGKRIEYFEKPLNELYVTIDNDYYDQNNAMLCIVGTSEIIYQRENYLTDLQDYAIDKFIDGLPKLDEDTAKELVSILNNRMEKLDALAIQGSPYFKHLYHLTIEKIRKFYHKLIGSSKIQTSKVFKVYQDDEYAKLVYKNIMPEKSFIDLYMDAASTNSDDYYELLLKVHNLYDYARRNVDLDINGNYRIPIRSRNQIDIIF